MFRPQIDIIKPNISELYTIVKKCAADGRILSGKSFVNNALRNYEDKMDPDTFDLKDIRILANALWQQQHKDASQQLHPAAASPRRVRGKHVLVSMVLLSFTAIRDV